MRGTVPCMSRLLEAEVFVAAVEAGSLTAASKQLGLTTSYASKLVTRLEERLGVPLLIRTTRKLTLTEAGRIYLARTTEALQGLEQAESMAAELQLRPTGTLRVTLPGGFGTQFVLGALADFAGLYPDLKLELVFLDRQVDMIGEGYDVGIRAGSLGDDRLIARKLASADRVVCASPTYLERAGAPDTPDALMNHACLLYAYHAAPGRWRMRGPDGEREVEVSGPIVANNGLQLVEAAVLGRGLVFVPTFHVAAELRAGRLRRVLPAWGWQIGVFAVYPPTQRVPIKVRVFVDFMLERMREPPWAGVAG